MKKLLQLSGEEIVRQFLLDKPAYRIDSCPENDFNCKPTQDLSGAPTASKPTPEKEDPQPLARVLVMDDESIVREVMEDILGEFGYHVECVVNGDEAVARCRDAREKGSPFDVVILDLEVPVGMGGREAVVALKAIDPNISAIVTSGDGGHPVMVDYRRYGFDAVLVKPCNIATMKRTLAEVIAR